jgi:ferredoxin-NADP reductase/predicted amidohydrolase
MAATASRRPNVRAVLTRIAAVQPRLHQAAVETNLALVEDLVRDAHRVHAPDLIVLPAEIGAARDSGAQARPVDGAPLALLRQLAAELQCVVAGGASAVRGRDAYATYFLVEPDGRIHLHDKNTASGREQFRLRSGSDDGLTAVVAWHRARVGLVSGLEWAQVRTAARLRAAAAGLVVGGQAGDTWPLADRADLTGRLPGLMARQVGAPVVMAAHSSVGGTQICDRDGTVLARLDRADGEGHVSATVRLGPSEPIDRPRGGTWTVDLGRATVSALRTLTAVGATTYRLRRTTRRFAWQDCPATDLPDELGPGGPRPHRGGSLPAREVVVTARRALADGVVGLTFSAADGGLLPVWAAGAHIDLLLPNDLIRQYSLCGEPTSGRFDIAVLDVPGGRGGSRWIHQNLMPGERLQVRGPRNHFALSAGSQPVFLAGGIGITPIRAMVHEARARGLDWRLIYGGRTHSAMAFVDELRALDPQRVRVVPLDVDGLLDLDGTVANLPGRAEVFACGPAGMLEVLEKLFAEDTTGRLHLERFEPRLSPVDRVDADFTITLASSGRQMVVPAHRRALDVLREAGVPVDSACRAGVCGSCAVRVLDGTPDHRDSIGESGRPENAMMVCVSRSLTPDLTLEV